ncbi:MAG: hypothetical protein JRN21_07755 [Nitrososphaerota archaeon]|nr:hypothetical protein [Nitrososphaerota archaeon]
MNSDEERAEDLLDKLILDIKAVTLLLGSEDELKRTLDGRLTSSHDESLQKFVRVLQMREGKRTGRLVAIALGELMLASILVAAGAVMLVPNVAGIDTVSGLLGYLAGRASGALVGSPLSPYLSFMEFAIGLVLLLSAFYSLREAANNLKGAGFSAEPT